MRWEVKNVSDGFANNMLLPRKLAVLATDSAVRNMERTKVQSEAEKKIQEELLDKTISDLSSKKVVIKTKANDSGHIFAGLHKIDILKAIEKETKIKLPEAVLVMEGMIKEIGEHKIPLIFGNKKVDLEVLVEGV